MENTASSMNQSSKAPGNIIDATLNNNVNSSSVFIEGNAPHTMLVSGSKINNSEMQQQPAASKITAKRTHEEVKSSSKKTVNGGTHASANSSKAAGLGPTYRRGGAGSSVNKPFLRKPTVE